MFLACRWGASRNSPASPPAAPPRHFLLRVHRRESLARAGERCSSSWIERPSANFRFTLPALKKRPPAGRRRQEARRPFRRTTLAKWLSGYSVLMCYTVSDKDQRRRWRCPNTWVSPKSPPQTFRQHPAWLQRWRRRRQYPLDAVGGSVLPPKTRL